MFVSKVAMEGLPNIHPVTMFIMVLTFSYGWRAVIPVYVFVLLTGIYNGFPIWWIPYLYLWAVIWALTLLIPYDRIPKKARFFVIPIFCGFFGLIYGTLYSPAQAILFKMSFGTTLRWIAAGLPWDCVHAAGNVVIGTLIVPLTELTRKLKAETE